MSSLKDKEIPSLKVLPGELPLLRFRSRVHGTRTVKESLYGIASVIQRETFKMVTRET